jgi:hypothetical protein
MQNLKIIVTLSALCLLSAPAYAAGKTKNATQAPSTPTYTSSSPTLDNTIHWNVSGPFALVGGTATFGAFVSGDYYITREITVGGESGFLIGSNSGFTEWEIPIVPTAKYHFLIQTMPNLRPYVGVGLGLGIAHFSSGGAETVTVNGTTETLTVGGSSGTEAVFHGEIQLGTAFQDGPGLMAVLRLGIIDSSFLFAPSVGWNF